jgi:uncharacterized protein (TIGR02444 family)
MSDATPSQASDGSLWTFAVRLYAAPGVADACLGLQDRFGCDVNLLLFAAWMAAVGKHTLTSKEMNEAALDVQDWRTEIVRPLRGVRRRLKTDPPLVPDAASEALRAGIKAIEMEAERLQLARLERLAAKWHAGPTRQSGGDASANLKTALRVFVDDQSPPEALELIRAIDNGLTHMTSLASP